MEPGPTSTCIFAAMHVFAGHHRCGPQTPWQLVLNVPVEDQYFRAMVGLLTGLIFQGGRPAGDYIIVEFVGTLAVPLTRRLTIRNRRLKSRRVNTPLFLGFALRGDHIDVDTNMAIIRLTPAIGGDRQSLGALITAPTKDEFTPTISPSASPLHDRS